MNSAKTSFDLRNLTAPAVLLAIAVAAGAFFVLFGWFPYASGYGATRVNMFHFMA